MDLVTSRGGRLSRRALLLLGAAAAGCRSGGGDAAPLRLATGPAGGAYGVLGDRFAAELRRRGLRVQVTKTAASVENLELLAAGRADLGFALADSAEDAVRVRRRPICALARMYLNYVHLVVPDGSKVRAPADLDGRAVSIGAEGSGTAVTAERVLAAAGPVRPARTLRLGLEESIAALRDGRIEAFFWSGGVPTPAVDALGRAAPIRLVALSGLVRRMRRSYGPMYEPVPVPAGAYGGTAPVSTIGTASYLVCRRALGAGTAFRATEVLFSSRDRLRVPDAPGARLDRRYAVGTGGVPLHAGAVRYYRSVYD
ncbi:MULTISPECIES: TAXI family TRAP transporter solute-binding subunit [Actinomadura]|uniref:TAXI family TRAP transporter solute-binding subunit n=1 Tax=Actinomadura yumaensis TaxID=111807 RepID=A0ABW2CQY3_9ACTN|nr:TAXI family TRAP transporter solute-binding subunit [Actinomadura sp. J1-007]MWK40441.1 TAXI family TRAP transporter solute-binding subunit [Actinomadura sp. J1-007]